MCGGYWQIRFETPEDCQNAGLFFEDNGFKWTLDCTIDPSPAPRKCYLKVFASCAQYELKNTGQSSGSLCTTFTPFFLKVTNLYVHHLAAQRSAPYYDVKYWEIPCFSDGEDPVCKELGI